MKYLIRLDKESNGVLIWELPKFKLIKMIAVPPGVGCFLVGLAEHEFSYNGLVLIRESNLSMLYQNGELIDLKGKLINYEEN